LVAILPKVVDYGVILAAPIFDHSKVAIIDEISRSGLPPKNPFFGEPGENTRLAYYYLWHFSAAELSLLLGASGWEADAALTWFTAFSSLMLMVGLARWISGRGSAAIWVLLLAATASLRPVLGFVFFPEVLDPLISPATGFGGWLFQASWAPQHLASASCVVLATLLMGQIAHRASFFLLATFVLVVVAGFESSTWVGGITFAVAAVMAGTAMLMRCKPPQRLPFLMRGMTAAAFAVGLASPLLLDQYVTTVMSSGDLPIAVHPYEVLGELLPEGLRRVLDVPAFWLVLLVVEFPAFYVTGSVELAHVLGSRETEPAQMDAAVPLASLAGASLMIAWLFVSTIGGNNDLGWRAALPGIIVLLVFAAVGLSRWLAASAAIAATAAISAFVLGLPGGIRILHDSAVGIAQSPKEDFAATPVMWDAVRRHSSPDERIGNNPLFLQHVTPWPINISWALLSNRRSCFAGRELALVFVPLSSLRREEINAQFIRVFAGRGSTNDVRELANVYGCQVIVVTATDGAWLHDPFAASTYYRLVNETSDKWRIYRATGATMGLIEGLE
jgi:hypothetical protein